MAANYLHMEVYLPFSLFLIFLAYKSSLLISQMGNTLNLHVDGSTF
jgi:hypothetical protein